MLPLPPIPPMRDVLLVAVGALVTGLGLACVAAPAPYHILVLPLAIAGAACAVPVLVRE